MQLPDGPAYFTSRGSVMGQVPGEVVAAAFAVFNPEAVVPAVEFGWSKVDAPTICAARTRGAVAQLVRVLGPEPAGLGRATELLAQAVAPLRPEGKPLFAGLRSLGLPGDPDGRPVAPGRPARASTEATPTPRRGRRPAWTPPRSGLLTELYWGLPLRTYVRTRAWSDGQLDAAEGRLSERGLVADGALTEAGRALRESVEVATDAQCEPVLVALGDAFDELIGLLAPWGQAIRDAGGYPPQGPHDLAPAR